LETRREGRDEALAGRAALQLGEERLQIRARAGRFGDVALFRVKFLVFLSRKEDRDADRLDRSDRRGSGLNRSDGSRRRGDAQEREPAPLSRAATRGLVRSTVATTAAPRRMSRIAAARRVMA